MNKNEQTILPEPKMRRVKVKVSDAVTIYTTRKKIKEAGGVKKYIELYKKRVKETSLRWN